MEKKIYNSPDFGSLLDEFFPKEIRLEFSESEKEFMKKTDIFCQNFHDTFSLFEHTESKIWFFKLFYTKLFYECVHIEMKNQKIDLESSKIYVKKLFDKILYER